LPVRQPASKPAISLDDSFVVTALATWLRMLFVAMGMLALSRLLLITIHRSHFAGLPWQTMARAWGTGMRFDLATALLTITLPITLLWLPWPSRLVRHIITVASWLTALLLTVAAIFLWGDLLFFEENWHHLTFEPTNIFHDLGPMLKLVLREYPLHALGLILFCIVLVRITRWQYRPLIRNPRRSRWWSYPVMIALMCAMTVTGVRGGLQKEALRSSDAVIGAGPASAANLALNGWYSFLVTMYDRSQPPEKRLPEADAIATTRQLIAAPQDRFESEHYPLLRLTPSQAALVAPGEKLNVVLLAIESLNASYLQSFGGSKRVMPFLDSLAEQSRIYTHCSAVATRSFRGLCAILASLPNVGDNPYTLTFNLPQLRGMGDLFREHGYHARFMHAAAPGSQGIMAIAYMAGYPEFVSADNFPSSEFNGSWGVWDHLALEKMTQEMDSMPEPFHYGIFTLSTHAPWTLPAGFVAPFADSVENAQMLNTYAYLDVALKDFFAREAARERFHHTLYVIVGDHTSHASEAERFRIGCIFYAPGRLEPAVDDRSVSQLDVMPTILDLAGIDAENSCFGRSMMDSTRTDRYSLMSQSFLLYWEHRGRTYVTDGHRDLALFDPQRDPGGEENLLPAEPETAAELRHEFDAYYQTSKMLFSTNRIFPENYALKN
jgi:phosphoglycerol transferase MdoB-like AlkP superfamily enzyme